MNRFGINLWNWTTGIEQDCLPLIAHAAKLGFTAVELPMTQPTVQDAEAFKVALQQYDMQVTLCASLTAGRDISNTDSVVRDQTKAYMRACIDTAASLGAQVFAGPLYAGGGKRHRLDAQERAQEWQRAVDGLVEMADYAKTRGISLAIEPIQRYRTSVVNTTDQALQMVADIRRENVGIHFDTFHSNIEDEDVCQALESVLKAGKLTHFHACANHRGAPGTGHLPWEKILSLLVQYGYTGHITMETFCEGSLDESWVPLAASQDALAQAGIDYLRQTMQRLTSAAKSG